MTLQQRNERAWDPGPAFHKPKTRLAVSVFIAWEEVLFPFKMYKPSNNGCFVMNFYVYEPLIPFDVNKFSSFLHEDQYRGLSCLRCYAYLWGSAISDLQDCTKKKKLFWMFFFRVRLRNSCQVSHCWINALKLAVRNFKVETSFCQSFRQANSSDIYVFSIRRNVIYSYPGIECNITI